MWQLPEEFQTLPRMMRLRLLETEWPAMDEPRELTPGEKREVFARLLCLARQYHEQVASNRAHRAMMAARAACGCFQSQPLEQRRAMLADARRTRAGKGER